MSQFVEPGDSACHIFWFELVEVRELVAPCHRDDERRPSRLQPVCAHPVLGAGEEPLDAAPEEVWQAVKV